MSQRAQNHLYLQLLKLLKNSQIKVKMTHFRYILDPPVPHRKWNLWGPEGKVPSGPARYLRPCVEGVIQGPLAPWMTPLTTHIGQAPSAAPAVSTLSDPGALISSGALGGPGTLDGPGALEGTGSLRVPGVLSGTGALSGSGALRGPGALSDFGALSGSGALSDPGRRRQW